MAIAATPLVTADEFARMEPERSTELIRGEIIEVAPPGDLHGIQTTNAVGLLWEWSPRQSKGVILSNDTGLIVAKSPDTVLGPDVMFYSRERIPKKGFTGGWLEVPPDLVIEVRSPSNRWADLIEKVGLYLKFGVREVWVLNPARRTVHVYRPEPESEPTVLDEAAELSTDVLPGFRCVVREFFAGVDPSH